MLITGFPAGVFQTNCYVLADGPRADAVVVDPGQDAVEPLKALLAEHRLNPVAVLLTHGHLDHTWTAQPIADEFGIRCTSTPRTGRCWPIPPSASAPRSAR